MFAGLRMCVCVRLNNEVRVFGVCYWLIDRGNNRVQIEANAFRLPLTGSHGCPGYRDLH